jgi:hypothetical protein
MSVPTPTRLFGWPQQHADIFAVEELSPELPEHLTAAGIGDAFQALS